MIDAPWWVRPTIALLTAAALGACSQGGAPRDPGPEGLPRGEVVIDTEEGEVRVAVEIAETPEDKARGLMGRESLPPDAGMVFLEEEPVETGFWMKDTLIPLSIAFWDREGRIFRILDMEPCLDDDCPTYYPRGPWVGALEVNQGFFEERGVEVGDRVKLVRLGSV